MLGPVLGATWQGAPGADCFLPRALMLSEEKWLEMAEEPGEGPQVCCTCQT